MQNCIRPIFRLLVLALFAVLLFAGCASTNRYQEPDDVYVTEADRASERAEQMAAEEQAANPNDEGITARENGPYPENEDDGLTPSERARQKAAQERAARQANRGAANRTLWYVIGGALEIAFNILLLYLFW